MLLTARPIKCKMRPTGKYRYYDKDTLVAKECLECEVLKDISQFHRAKDKLDGTVSKCSECLKGKYNTEYKEKYAASGSRVPGWIEEVIRGTALEGLTFEVSRRYRGWQGARFYHTDGTLAGKICPSCRKALVSVCFSTNTGHTDGLSTYCNLCNGSLNKEYHRLRNEDDPMRSKTQSKRAYDKYFSRSDEEIKYARKNLHPSGTKICRVCRESLYFSKYDVGRGRPDGLASDCKSCKKTRRKKICVDYWTAKGIPLECYLSGCSRPFEEIDHVVPTSLDGPDELSNLLPMCGTHNRRKHGKLLILWLSESHPEVLQETLDLVASYGIDYTGTYVPINY